MKNISARVLGSPWKCETLSTTCTRPRRHRLNVFLPCYEWTEIIIRSLFDIHVGVSLSTATTVFSLKNDGTLLSIFFELFANTGYQTPLPSHRLLRSSLLLISSVVLERSHVFSRKPACLTFHYQEPWPASRSRPG